MNKIFVYGTLRKGMYYHYYLEKEMFGGYGYIEGGLYTLVNRHYPAFVLEGRDMIKGEVYQINDAKLKEIDALEGYYSKDNINNEYDKQLLNIYDENHQITDKAYVYILNKNNSLNTLDSIITECDFAMYNKR